MDLLMAKYGLSIRCLAWGHLAWRPAPFSGTPVCRECGEVVRPEDVLARAVEVMRAHSARELERQQGGWPQWGDVARWR